MTSLLSKLSLTKNEKLILQLIYQHRSISRPELLHISRLKTATLYRTIDALVEKRMVVVSRGDEAASVGRPSDVLSVNGAYAFICSISVQRFAATVAVVDFAGEITAQTEFSCDEDTLPEDVVRRCWETYREIAAPLGLHRARMIGVAISTFGVPTYSRDSTPFPVYPGFTWNKFDYTGALQNAFGKPVWFEYNARAAAWGNYICRYLREGRNLAYVIINEGIGTGIIVDGRMIYGSQRIVNGLGHMVVDIKGEPCVCGKYGCVETRASATAIVTRARNELRLGKRSVLHPARLTCGDVCAAADAGDPVAAYVVEDAASVFEIGLENFLNILDISLVIVGGSVPSSSRLYCETVEKRLKSRLPGVAFRVEDNEMEMLIKGVAAAFMMELFN